MYNIIYFGNDWYAENKTSSHHIAEQLSKQHKVLYIECPGLRSPRANARDFKKLFSKVAKCLKRPRQVTSNLSIYTLFQIPFHRFSLIRALNRLLTRTTVKLLIHTLKMHSPLLWFVVPHLNSIPKSTPCLASIYYCIDDYSALPDIDAESVAQMDEDMTQKADIVFIASATLMEKKCLLNPNVHLSPHGVNFDHFNRVYTGDVSTPADVQALSTKPVIGFFGLIEEWIDLELIKYVAQRHPDWHILMIGLVAVAHNPCKNLANVHFIGRREFNLLPDYASVFNACILPYKLNRQVLNSNPIKLREYLATGLPVVSVRFPQVEQYGNVVSIADNYQEFDSYLEANMHQNDSIKRNQRVDSVKNMTWEARVENVLQVIDEFLQQQKHP